MCGFHGYIVYAGSMFFHKNCLYCFVCIVPLILSISDTEKKFQERNINLINNIDDNILF